MTAPACAGTASRTCLPGAWACDRHEFETAVVSIAVARDIARHEMTDALTALRAKVWDA